MLRRLFGRPQISDVLDDYMEIAKDEIAVPAFQAAAHTYLYTLPGEIWQLLGWICGMLVVDMLSNFETLLSPYLVLLPTTMASASGSVCHVMWSVSESRDACILFHVVQLRPLTNPSLRPLRWTSFKLTRPFRFRRRTIPQPRDWPTGGIT